MKSYIVLILTIIILLPISLKAQLSQEPLSFDKFYKKDTTKIFNGYYTVYVADNKYYLEIPVTAFEKEILITTHVVKGPASFVSPASGVMQFKEGRNNTLEVYKNMTADIVSDTTNFSICMAMEKSSFIPVYYTFPIYARGENNRSVIIDLTSELNNPTGFFPVNSYHWLTRPDPQRSGIDSCRMIENGVVFSVYRTQTDFQSNPQTRSGQDIVSSFNLEMLIQEIPENKIELVETHPAYGFETISKSIYDTKQYLVQKKEYIQRWNISKSGANKITVYLDPKTPEPFRESILNALAQWQKAFEKAGYRNIFDITSDINRSSLSYRTLLIHWGNAYAGVLTKHIHHPLTGEILCAKVNITDSQVDAVMEDYLFKCGLIDKRVQKNMYDLSVRQDILTAQVASALGRVFGLKENFAGYTAFSLSDLRSASKLAKYGTTASITAPFNFNYALKAQDKVNPSDLLPKVSIYDEEAIDFAYGKRKTPPSLKSSYYTDNKKNDPYSQPVALSRDILEASIAGIENLKAIYPQFEKIIRNQSYPNNNWSNVGMLTAKAMILYQDYMKQIATLVGGKLPRAVIRKYNETSATYVSGSEQRKVLAYFEEELFTNPSMWLNVRKNLEACGLSIEAFSVQTADAVLKYIISPEVLGNLVEAEDKKLADILTYNELFDYLDRVIFHDFKDVSQLTSYQKNIQSNFIVALGESAAKNNITGGLSDNLNALHTYLYRTTKKIKELAENQTSPQSKDFYDFMMVKLRRTYFN